MELGLEMEALKKLRDEEDQEARKDLRDALTYRLEVAAKAALIRRRRAFEAEQAALTQLIERQCRR